MWPGVSEPLRKHSTFTPSSTLIAASRARCTRLDPAGRPAANMGERTGAKKIDDASLRVLAGALAERRAHVRPVYVEVDMERVCVCSWASRRRCAARDLTSCSCRQRGSYS
jgi:hypothetical protein